MRQRSLALALLAHAALALASCGGASDAEQMKGAIAPHLAEFAELDRWARRLALADSAFHSREAMSEAAFAPFRDRPQLRAAWIEREGPDPTAVAHPSDAPPAPSAGWIRVATEELGELTAQRAAIAIGGGSIGCVLVRRSRPAPGDAVLHVTAAFAP